MPKSACAFLKPVWPYLAISQTMTYIPPAKSVDVTANVKIWHWLDFRDSESVGIKNQYRASIPSLLSILSSCEVG